jgi:hypothetical protein
MGAKAYYVLAQAQTLTLASLFVVLSHVSWKIAYCGKGILLLAHIPNMFIIHY